MQTRIVHSCVLTFILLLLCFAQSSQSAAQQSESLPSLEKSFANPPDDCRIMMRWWWFGPAVTKPELQRELEQMKAPSASPRLKPESWACALTSL
jgi:hypothetical protein